MDEIIFEVTEDQVDGGYIASAIGYGIDTLGDLKEMVRDAVRCYFFDQEAPAHIRLRLHL